MDVCIQLKVVITLYIFFFLIIILKGIIITYNNIKTMKIIIRLDKKQKNT